MPPNLTTRYSPAPLDLLTELQDFIVSGTAVTARIEAGLRTLVQTHPLLSYEWESGHTFWRGRQRQTSQYHPTILDMLWPPPQSAGLGRSNLAGEPILYISDHIPTTIAEITNGTPTCMQFIAIEIRQGEKMRFVPVGEIAKIASQGRSLATTESERARTILGILNACPPEVARRLILSDQLIFDVYGTPGQHDAASIIANEMRNKLPEVDGIMYRSTKRSDALNIAMRPASLLSKCWIVAGLAADVCAIDHSGVCQIEGIEPVTAINEAGAFIWSGKKQTYTQIVRLEPPAMLAGITAP